MLDLSPSLPSHARISIHPETLVYEVDIAYRERVEGSRDVAAMLAPALPPGCRCTVNGVPGRLKDKEMGFVAEGDRQGGDQGEDGPAEWATEAKSSMPQGEAQDASGRTRPSCCVDRSPR